MFLTIKIKARGYKKFHGGDGCVSHFMVIVPGVQAMSKQTHKKVYSKYMQQLVDYIYVNEVEQRNVKNIYFK